MDPDYSRHFSKVSSLKNDSIIFSSKDTNNKEKLLFVKIEKLVLKKVQSKFARLNF